LQLKSGEFSTLCRATHRVSGKLVAVKCIRRDGLPPKDDAAVYDAVSILSSISHPHVVPLIDFFEEDDTYFLVRELLSGGEVLQRIGDMGSSYSEGDARDIMQRLFSALSCCHEHKIAHRDLNPTKIFLLNEEDDTHIKLVGFEFSARCHEPKSLNKQCGTPFFVAPEVLMKQPYDQESDIWSAGCIAFLLLSGYLPFVGLTQKELFRNIVSGKFELDEDAWSDVSDDAMNFLEQLIVLDPGKRLAAADALKHPWMQIPYSDLQERSLEEASERIKLFHEQMNPQKS
jgi:serine/threonine protein kinase